MAAGAVGAHTQNATRCFSSAFLGGTGMQFGHLSRALFTSARVCTSLHRKQGGQLLIKLTWLPKLTSPTAVVK